MKSSKRRPNEETHHRFDIHVLTNKPLKQKEQVESTDQPEKQSQGVIFTIYINVQQYVSQDRKEQGYTTKVEGISAKKSENPSPQGAADATCISSERKT